MNRQQKSDVVKILETKFAESKGSFLVGCQGLSVGQMQDLRGELYDNSATVYVAKNRLVKLAVKNSAGSEQLDYDNESVKFASRMRSMEGEGSIKFESSPIVITINSDSD